MFQMFKRNAKNDCNEISDAEANIIASGKLKFWLKRISCAMAMAKTLRLRLCALLIEPIN